MQLEQLNRHYVLALYPSTQGLAFALFEGPLSLVDWGTTAKCGPGKNTHCVGFVERLIDCYVPDVIIFEDDGRPRNARVQSLYRAFATVAGNRNIDVVRYGRADVRKVFSATGAKTKHERAQIVASILSQLAHRLPPRRKAWMSEHPRMALFEAAALGLTYYGQGRSLVE